MLISPLNNKSNKKYPIMLYVHSLYETMGFGKHSNETLKEVIDNDPSYIRWCLGNVPTFAMTDNATSYYHGNKTAAEDTEDCGWEERDDYWDDDQYWDDEENVSSNPYYNDDLDMDQQSPEFWDSIF